MDGLIEALIAAACLADAYRKAAAEQPQLADGWLKKADQWSARTAALASRVAEAAAGQTREGDRRPLPRSDSAHRN